jgi:hypothetical protein
MHDEYAITEAFAEINGSALQILNCREAEWGKLKKTIVSNNKWSEEPSLQLLSAWLVGELNEEVSYNGNIR